MRPDEPPERRTTDPALLRRRRRRARPPSGTWTNARSAATCTARCSACSTWWMRCPCRSAHRSTAPGLAADRAPAAGAAAGWLGSGCRVRWRWAWPRCALAGLLVAAFLAGRFYPRPAIASRRRWPAADPQAGERVLLVAVGDYLERSQMVLIELANANPHGTLDISAEQERAADLVSESRCTGRRRRTPATAPWPACWTNWSACCWISPTEPSQPPAGGLEKLREPPGHEGILFKIRVLGSNVRQREECGRRAPGNARTDYEKGQDTMQTANSQFRFAVAWSLAGAPWPRRQRRRRRRRQPPARRRCRAVPSVPSDDADERRSRPTRPLPPVDPGGQLSA